MRASTCRGVGHSRFSCTLALWSVDTTAMRPTPLPTALVAAAPRRIAYHWCDGTERLYLVNWVGVPLAVAAVEEYVPQSLPWLDAWWGAVESLMRRPDRPSDAMPVGTSANADGLRHGYPLLADHLTATQYEDGGPREVSTLLVFSQDGLWKCCLRDRQEGRCLWAAAPKWSDLFDVLEAALGDPMAVWRDDRLAGAPAAGRQKKRS